MSLPGLTPEEVFLLVRTLGAQDDKGSKRPIKYPVKAGKLLLKSINAGATYSTLLEFFKSKKRLTNDSMIRAHIKIVEKIDEKYHNIIKYGEFKEIGDITYDQAQTIANWPDDLIEEIIPNIVSYGLQRSDLRGIFQRMERGNVTLEVAMEEFREQNNKIIQSSYFSSIRDKSVLKYLKKQDLTVISEELSKKEDFLKFFETEKRKLVSVKVFENSFSVSFLGKPLGKLKKDKLETIVQTFLKKAV